MLGLHPGGEPRDAPGVGDVELVDEYAAGSAAELPGHRVPALGVAGAEHHEEAVPGEPADHLAADAAGGARHDGDARWGRRAQAGPP